MLKDFVFHASLLVSSFFFIGHWFRKFPLYRSSPWKIKLAAGFLYGLLGLVLMLFSIPINSIIIDLRHIPIIVAALGGGPLPALIAASIIATGRLTLFGGPTFPAVVASINLMMLGAVCGWLGGRRGITLLRFLLLDTFFMISNSISICISLYHLGQQADALCILIFMWTFSNVVGLLAVYVYQYILRSHAEGLKLAESEKRYRRLISQSPDAVFVQTADRILFVNDMGLRLLGAGSREELLGRSFIDFVRADGRDELLRRWKAMGAGAEAIDLVELHCTMLTGKEIIVELSISPIVYED
ncbi:PAS domain S-box protein [Paenibacillus filicis]|uniref:PAS domain S-box protein n=1 Tax=Paenibacillus gyeongsangnamensis TaxID=3388067 RepID=A0ABT4QE29_9BACL|nr:LytS/YhcK type 5TM receptor domain-containing protein [Paenibacillus filicis]MCZ8514930.1 PAS domain S-box protein [Paenibacillus filicis]